MAALSVPKMRFPIRKTEENGLARSLIVKIFLSLFRACGFILFLNLAGINFRMGEKIVFNSSGKTLEKSFHRNGGTFYFIQCCP